MQEEIINALQQRRAQIRARWETLLRIEKTTSPLANPDTLVFGLDQSLDEIFAALRQSPPPQPDPKPLAVTSPNPWQAYFRAGEQALLESLILLQAEGELLDPATRDRSFGLLKQEIHNLTQREIKAWDAICRPTGQPRRKHVPKKPVRARTRRTKAATGT